MLPTVQTLPSRHRITAEEYQKMGEAGIFTEDDRVELIEGEIIDMALIGSRHAGVVAKLGHILSRAVGNTAVVWVQNPILLDDHSEPEPDVVLLKPRRDFYAASLPTAQDVLLLIEVADTSSDYDRNIKMPLYARHGIPEAWLVDLPGGFVEVWQQPSPQGYCQTRRHFPGERIQPELVPDVTLEITEIVLIAGGAP